LALEDQFITVFLNYGIAGLILFVFYMLFKNELSQLRASIEKLDDRIDKLAERIESLTTIMERREREG
jgi:flagellar capping protein FliD